MLGILASLVITGAGVGAIAAIAMTIHQQSGAVRQLFADSRSIARDREFLVRMTGDVQLASDAQSASPLMFARLRRVPQRAVKRLVVQPRPLWPDHSRAA